jgi:hypothetical protein
VQECVKSTGCVVASGDIVKERINTIGRVKAAGDIVSERLFPLAVLPSPSVLP